MSILSEIRKGSLLVILGSGLLATTVRAEEEARLELAAWLNEPGGPQIANGEYLEAVAAIEPKLRSTRPLERLVAYNNLCVAQTMLGELEAARSACDSAVARARNYERLSRMRDRSASAKALSNRGVVHILNDELDMAIIDLERAGARGETGWTAPARNLAYIGERLAAQSFADSD